MSSVGNPVPHESATGHVTGQALYTDDLWPRMRRLVHMAPVQSPYAHARVDAIDIDPALAIQGVLGVLRKEDVPGDDDLGAMRRDEPLFPSEVSFHGQAVCWVVAETEELARLAATRVEVQYEPLPALLSLEEAIEAASFLTSPERIERGEVDTSLAQAPLRMMGEVRSGAQEHFYLETQAAIAYIDESDQVMVHSSTQHPSQTQEMVARLLGVARNQVVVQCLRMGGAFGGKESQANAWAALAALAACKFKRPARVRLDRLRDMQLTGKRHPFLSRFVVGFHEDGRLAALDLQLFSDGGASLDLSGPIMGRAVFHVDNAYYLPHVRVVGRAVKTNHVSHTAFRGFGGPQGMLVIEEILDRIARTLGLPPHLVRERNFYQPGHTTHYEQPVRDAERITRIWSELKESSDFLTRIEEVRRFNRESPYVKRGIAITPVKFGISFTATFYNQAGALVLVYKDGSVQVNHGGTEMGQGLYTKVRQVAADALGVPLDSIRVMPTRTDKVPNTSATAASSGADLNCAAVELACQEIRARLTTVAASHFDASAEEVRFEEGNVLGPSGGLSFAKLVSMAYLQRVSLFSTGHYRTPGIHYDASSGRGKPFHYFAYGAAVSEVEVDGFTGQHQLRRVDILHDVGNSISPIVDRGQIEGGFLQGAGWLTREEVVWDGEGRLATSGPSTYKLPSAHDCPPDLRVATLARADEPAVVRGSKAVGEPPFMLALSVREALRDAVAAFGDESARVPVQLAAPSTPEAVYFAIERARASREEGEASREEGEASREEGEASREEGDAGSAATESY